MDDLKRDALLLVARHPASVRRHAMLKNWYYYLPILSTPKSLFFKGLTILIPPKNKAYGDGES